MFTGLIEDLGTVVELARRAPMSLLRLRPDRLDPTELSTGDSVAVNGACLTVTAADRTTFTAEASPETLARTTLGALRPGAQVHLERAMRLGDRLGGHLVLGHVDGVGRIRRVQQLGDGRLLEVGCPPEVAGLLVYKGSITLHGVSLTVNELLGDGFTVLVIPHTGQVTLLGGLSVGQRVNLEADIIGKYVFAALRGTAAYDAGGSAASSQPGTGGGAPDGGLVEALRQGGFWSGGPGGR